MFSEFISELMERDPEIKLVRGKIELFWDGEFFKVENTALKKTRTVTQSRSFDSALQAFKSEIEK